VGHQVDILIEKNAGDLRQMRNLPTMQHMVVITISASLPPLPRNPMRTTPGEETVIEVVLRLRINMPAAVVAVCVAVVAGVETEEEKPGVLVVAAHDQVHHRDHRRSILLIDKNTKTHQNGSIDQNMAAIILAGRPATRVVLPLRHILHRVATIIILIIIHILITNNIITIIIRLPHTLLAWATIH
jgi:hypothetical protein